jgi:hypothetical protein
VVFVGIVMCVWRAEKSQNVNDRMHENYSMLRVLGVRGTDDELQVHFSLIKLS